VKFELTDSFRGDRRRLSRNTRKIIDDVLPDFVAACDRFAADPATGWPDSLRVKAVEGAPGVFEMTFSFSGPDIRATFEWITIEGEPAVRWRRIGDHRIFRRP
jgi:hypothetical protein